MWGGVGDRALLLLCLLGDRRASLDAGSCDCVGRVGAGSDVCWAVFKVLVLAYVAGLTVAVLGG